MESAGGVGFGSHSGFRIQIYCMLTTVEQLAPRVSSRRKTPRPPWRIKREEGRHRTVEVDW
eukprot:8293825-Pyramimonas_sp.AAC.1